MGAAVTKTIGTSGGSLSSADGGVTFDTDKFVGGTQSNLPDDVHQQNWVWTITQF